MISSKITVLAGSKPGPNLAIFAGVHGDELAGVLALQELLPYLKITRGKLFVAFANPLGIEQNVRAVNKNLNRCFIKDNQGTTPEDERARELMKVLDKCDALLDLHMFSDDNGRPFVICEDNAIDIAQKFEVDIVSTNWAAAEPGGSDAYMYLSGKIGICVECGPRSKAEEYKDMAIKTIYQFLKYFKMTNKRVEFSTKPKRTIKAWQTVYKKSEKFVLKKDLHNFDTLKNGQVIATEASKKYRAKSGEFIIFPNYRAGVGDEAYIIGKEQ